MIPTTTSDISAGTSVPTRITSEQKQHIMNLLIDGFDLDELLDRLTNDDAQRIVTRGDEFKDAVVKEADINRLVKVIDKYCDINLYADEEVESSYKYPAGYALKPITDQVNILSSQYLLTDSLHGSKLQN